MIMRECSRSRKTAETEIGMTLCLDGTGESSVDTGCGFLNHMLTLFAKHGRFGVTVKCCGDTDVDYHHTTEDIGIVLGECFAECLGDKRGIRRYGSCILPMDESLVLTAADFSGRACLVYDLGVPAQKVGDFDTELVEEFWNGFVRGAGANLHIKKLDGTNSHHLIEACFKSVARSFREAVSFDKDFPDEIPSTKGVL